MPANPVKGQVARKVGGEEYILAYPLNTQVAYEAEVGRKFADDMPAMLEGKLTSAEVRRFFRFGLWRNHPQLNDEDVGDLIGVMGDNEAALWFAECLEATWGIRVKGGDADPPAPAGDPGTGTPASPSGTNSTSEAPPSSGT